MAMNIKEIVRSSGMIADPDYYSGRGVTTSDLNLNILNELADSVEKSYGNEALEAFIQMVWNMPVLSTNAFLYNLFALERSGWKLDQIKLKVSDDNFESEAGARGVVLTLMSGAGRSNDTEWIRAGFRKK